MPMLVAIFVLASVALLGLSALYFHSESRSGNRAPRAPRTAAVRVHNPGVQLAQAGAGDVRVNPAPHHRGQQVLLTQEAGSQAISGKLSRTDSCQGQE